MGVHRWCDTAEVEPDSSRLVESALPIDLELSLGPLCRGSHDPVMRRRAKNEYVRAIRTSEGPVTLRFVQRSATNVHVEAFGPGHRFAIEHCPDFVGANDSLEGFEPSGPVAELHRRFAGLRMIRTRTLFQNLLVSVLEQKVHGKDAFMSYRAIVRELGEPAPGPFELWLTPEPALLGTQPSFRMREFGVDAKRSSALQFAARRAARLEKLCDGPLEGAHRYLRAMPGIGVWTAAEVLRPTMGDADAVSVGDFHVPNMVAWHLAGEARADDARMLELLEPFSGHRGRVVALLGALGQGAPKFGPRSGLRPFVAGAIRPFRKGSW